MIRSFLAIELPTIIRHRLSDIQKDLKTSDADVRWVNPDSVHLTLKFFGNIEESRIDTIVESIAVPIRTTPSFSLKVQGTGAFPHVNNPRVVWVGLREGIEVLRHLQKQLEASMEKSGFPAENRPFHPHLTIGRVKSNRGKGALVAKIDKYREEELGQFQAEKVILFRSDLTPFGPIYSSLRELRFVSSS